MTQVRETWQSQLHEELAFWDRYLATRGDKWPDEFTQRIDPEAPLAESEIASRIRGNRTRAVRILDVGAGPLTILGKRLPNAMLDITAVDPLAGDYNRLLDRNGIVPPVRTQWCEGEHLTRKFSHNEFDFAYARNALDHAHDPLGVITQMVRVVREGGWVILRHRPKEAETAKYKGLHQWNFELREGNRFWISSRSTTHDVAATLQRIAAVDAKTDGPWLVCMLRKRHRWERWLRRAMGMGGPKV